MAFDDSNLEYVAFRNKVLNLLPQYMMEPAALRLHQDGTAAKALFDSAYYAHLESQNEEVARLNRVISQMMRDYPYAIPNGDPE